MAQQDIFDLWRQAPSSKPIHRDVYRRMHLSALRQAGRQQLAEKLFVLRYEVHDFVLCEWKGELPDVARFDLPAKDSSILWMCLHFQGRFTFPTGWASESDSFFSFTIEGIDPSLTLAKGNHWALLLGVSGTSKEQLLAELPPLREQYAAQLVDTVLPACPLSYQQRQVLDALSRTSCGPFSALYHIGLLVLRLYSGYVQQLERQASQPKDVAAIQLYHRAVAYIRDNYMDKALDRQMITEALHCSVRSLNRAFEGRPLSLNATILTIRLHKARELLLSQPELSVEQIALMLHFFDASHFSTQYKKQFNRTPRQERKNLEAPK